MITKIEFLKALETVNNYKKQVTEQYEEMKKDLDKKSFSHLPITKKTRIIDANLSVRTLNVLKSNIHKFESIKDLKWDFLECEVTVGHFEVLKRSDLYGFRNLGKKSIKELDRLFFEAGIIMID